MASERFGNRLALVVGGSGALGEACAARLGEEGARVVLLARDRDRLAASRARLGPACVDAIRADASSSRELEAAVGSIEERLGPIEILVYAAGIADEPSNPCQITDQEWREMFATNCDGFFFAVRAVLPQMRERDYGRIVAIASVAGRTGNPFEVAYSASKGAMITLVQSLGLYLAGTGIRIHSVAPTVIDSPLGTGPEVPPELVEYLISKVPTGKPGKPADVADMVAFLADERFVLSTGACFDLSGGQATH